MQTEAKKKRRVNQNLKSAFQFYIMEGHYRYMDKDRMKQIIFDLKKTSITDAQNEKLNEVLNSL